MGCNCSSLISILIKEVKIIEGKTCLVRLTQVLAIANPYYAP